jgi:hypothetical protein
VCVAGDLRPDRDEGFEDDFASYECLCGEFDPLVECADVGRNAPAAYILLLASCGRVCGDCDRRDERAEGGLNAPAASCDRECGDRDRRRERDDERRPLGVGVASARTI